MWYHFSFASGANPYIAKTESEAKKRIRSWERKGYEVTLIANRFYVVMDI